MFYLVGLICGFASSKLLHDFTHRRDFPEVGRYAVGIVALAISMKLAGIENEQVEKMLLEAGAVGAGVVIARLM